MAHEEHSSPELDLGPFIASTRRVLDRTADRRREAGVPPPPSIPSGSRRVALLVAAALVLVGGTVLALAGADALQQSARGTASEAEHSVQRGGPQLVAPTPTSVRAEPEPHQVTTATESEPPEAGVTAAPGGEPSEAQPSEAQPSEPTPEPAEEESIAPATKSTAADADAKPKTAAPRSKAERLAELARLDAEAQRLWKAGDTAGAEARFLKIVELGGHGRYAELAFGDLFTLAHQAKDPRREQRLWRRYLARFPRGRFADDVRAWQCRRATDDDRGRCWSRYLEDWPRGTYREEARRALPSDEGSP